MKKNLATDLFSKQAIDQVVNMIVGMPRKKAAELLKVDESTIFRNFVQDRTSLNRVIYEDACRALHCNPETGKRLTIHGRRAQSIALPIPAVFTEGRHKHEEIPEEIEFTIEEGRLILNLRKGNNGDPVAFFSAILDILTIAVSSMPDSYGLMRDEANRIYGRVEYLIDQTNSIRKKIDKGHKG